MTDQERPDTEPEELAEEPQVSRTKGRRAFSNVRRELSDEELSSPAIQRMLIDDIERLEKEKYELNEYYERYHEANKKTAILEERLKTSVAQEIIFSICLTVGSAALGYVPSVWTAQPTGWIAIAFGIVLIIGGIASKVVRR